jgi:hypothetical protein
LSFLFDLSIMHTRPSSFKASLISRMRIRSRALLENRRSFSRTTWKIITFYGMVLIQILDPDLVSMLRSHTLDSSHNSKKVLFF